jgi:hypothetical protein
MMILGSTFYAFLLAAPFCFLAPPHHQSAMAPETGGSLSGVVLDAQGHVLAKATVYGVPETDPRQQFHTITDDAGEFTLSKLPAGVLYLSAFKESDEYPYDFFSFFASPGANTPVKVELKARQEVKGLRIRLGEKSVRLNIVITTEDGKPLEKGAELIFSRPDQPGRPYNRGARQTESMLVPHVPFHLTVRADGYKEWHYGGSPSALVTPEPDEPLTVSVRLQRLAGAPAEHPR